VSAALAINTATATPAAPQRIVTIGIKALEPSLLVMAIPFIALSRGLSCCRPLGGPCAATSFNVEPRPKFPPVTTLYPVVLPSKCSLSASASSRDGRRRNRTKRKPGLAGLKSTTQFATCGRYSPSASASRPFRSDQRLTTFGAGRFEFEITEGRYRCHGDLLCFIVAYRYESGVACHSSLIVGTLFRVP